jgi:outer membrane protein insertion porin family
VVLLTAADIGYGDSYGNRSAGIALQWQAPIGPITISWAQPLKFDRELDRVEKLQFTFGTLF